MNKWQACPKCASTDILSPVRVVDHSDSGIRDLSLSFPGARIIGPLRLPKLVSLVATVCASCGYSELYAKDSRDVRDARDAQTAFTASAGQMQSPVEGTGSGNRPFMLIAVSLAALLAFAIAAFILVTGLLGPK